MKKLKSALGSFKRQIKSLIFNHLILRSVRNSDDLIRWHFNFWSDSNHVSKSGLKVALTHFGDKPLNILETGTSAWGTDSTRLFDSYVRKFGGSLISVDIRSLPSERLKNQLAGSSNLLVGDSVSEIEKLAESLSFDFIYLDSFDVDWMNPVPSALHGLSEMKVVLPRLKAESVVIIDDTPCSFDFQTPAESRARNEFTDEYGVNPGKGGLAVKFLDDIGVGYSVMHHSSNLVLQIQNFRASGRD